MINTHSIFRNALQISPETVSHLSDIQLNQLMGRLLLAQAYKCKSPASKIQTNTEIKAKDDGCDGWSEKPELPDEWLGDLKTCWQFKAGEAGEPAKLSGEVTKKFPRETLANGGRFVVVASGSTNGLTGELVRFESLVKAARNADLPTDKIDVIGSERLTNWCNQHPAIAAYYSGRPDGLWTFEKWSRSDDHQVPWQSSEATESIIIGLRDNLDFRSGEVFHLHIQGLPGVGKTRFALELCRGSEWCNAVVYIQQATDLRLEELLGGVIEDEYVQLMVVADEAQTNQLHYLRELISLGGGRVRLITIGHGNTPDPTRIPSIPIERLDDQSMRKIVKGWHSTMPPEHIDFIVRFADGYVRLAYLASNAVARNPSINVRELLKCDEIQGFLDRMLDTGDRRPLHVVAVLTSIGWTEDKQVEGSTVAKHFGLDWNNVRYSVDEFHKHFGIVPDGGRFRYISPTPLGILLAIEAWNCYPDLLRSLPDVLPTQESIDAYYSRLQSMASNLYARDFARKELSRFTCLNDFLDYRTVCRWTAISAADPNVAASNIFQALEQSSKDARLQIRGNTRQEIVGTLVRLAWKSSSFDNAIKSLALLAEAENESWSNNASGEFVDHFQIMLGGTAVPYQNRMTILDELIAMGRPSLIRLVVKALSKIGNRQWTRMGIEPPSDEVPELEWRPGSTEEYLECYRVAFIRLRGIANLAIPEIQDELIFSINDLSRLLQEKPLRNLVSGFIGAIYSAYPQTREYLRRIIAEFLRLEKLHIKSLAPEDLHEIEALHAKFQDTTLEARLFQYVGVSSWDPEDQPDLEPLALELLSNPELLAQHWLWLTSGEAASGWRLGETLARIDPDCRLAGMMPLFHGRGEDFRLLCAYINIRHNEMGDNWFDGWVNTYLNNNPDPIRFLFEIVSRCRATEYTAKKIIEALNNQEVNPHTVGLLTFGNWYASLSAFTLKIVIQALLDSGYHEISITILMQRMKKNPSEMEFWESLALKLVTFSELIRSNQTVSYYWMEIAKLILPIHSGKIAEAIIREHIEEKSNGWFLEFSNALPILQACLSENPSDNWEIIKPYLSTPDINMFSIGFPLGILDIIPTEKIMDWISEQPKKRVKIVSGLLSVNLSDDETITSQLIEKYGIDEEIASSFFSTYISGSWEGQASVHWDQLADNLDEVYKRTKLIKLHKWASKYSQNLRQMAARDRPSEKEDNIRRR